MEQGRYWEFAVNRFTTPTVAGNDNKDINKKMRSS